MGRTAKMYVLLFCIILPFVCAEEKEDSKRILITDPDYLISNELNAMKATIQQLQSKVAQLETKASSGGGSVFIRWGHHNCTNASEMIYSGFAGGSHYSYSGGAADYVCLPRDPEWGQYNKAVASHGAFMYGSEYEDNFFASTTRIDSDVPCAVCRSYNTAHVMIPGRLNCYGNWKKEYSGYLAAGNYNSASANQFVCVDSAVETIFHSQGNENGKLFYQVEGVCGSLSCPPYVAGREITCVVCTK